MRANTNPDINQEMAKTAMPGRKTNSNGFTNPLLKNQTLFKFVKSSLK
jgi:hypothetical protein